MEETQCIGCKTSFQEGETIDSQDTAIEFKNCSIPFKDETVKWSVLKSIVSFLNFKEESSTSELMRNKDQ